VQRRNAAPCSRSDVGSSVQATRNRAGFACRCDDAVKRRPFKSVLPLSGLRLHQHLNQVPLTVHGGMMQRSPAVRIELVGAGSGRKPLREILASRMLEEFQAVPSRSLGGNILSSVICRRLLENAGNRQSAALMQSRRYRRLYVAVNLALQDCLHLLVLPFFSIQCQPKYAIHSLDWPAPRNFSRSFEWNRFCRPLR